MHRLLRMVVSTAAAVLCGWAAESTASADGVPAPTNDAPPMVSGLAEVGQTLTVDNGAWSSPEPLSFGVQWQRCDGSGANCIDVPGATDSTYQVSSADLNSVLAVVVTATDSEGQSGSASVQTAVVTTAPAPVNTDAPVVSGPAQDGQTLTVSDGAWSSLDSISFAYQWQRCDPTGASCVDIDGAQSASYELGPTDVQSQLVAVVTATNGGGATSSFSLPSGLVEPPAAPVSLIAPSTPGSPQDGQVLTASNGQWASPDGLGFVYQWQRCDLSGGACVDIGGATSTSYTPEQTTSVISCWWWSQQPIRSHKAGRRLRTLWVQSRRRRRRPTK